MSGSSGPGDDAPALPQEAVTAWQGKVGPAHFIALGLLSMFAPLSIDMYLPALPIMTRSLHTNASIAQLTITACLIGISAGPLLVGPLADRLGRRRPLLVGIACYIVASLCCVFAPNVWVLIVFRFAQGFSGSAGVVLSVAVVRDMRAGNSAARLMSLLVLISGAAPAAAPVIGAQLLRLGSWRGVFLTLTIAGAVICLVTLLFLPETLPPEFRRPGGVRSTIAGFAELLGDRTFFCYAFSAGLVTGAMFAYIAGSPFVLENIFKLTPQEFSGVFAMNALGLIVAAQIGAAVVSRVGARMLVRVGVINVLVGAGALLFVVLVHGPLWAVLVCLFVCVSNNSIVGPNAQALAMTKYPHLAGSASALLSVMRFAIGGAVAPLVGLGGAHDAVPMAIVILGLALVAFVVVIWLGIRETSSSAAAAMSRTDTASPAVH